MQGMTSVITRTLQVSGKTVGQGQLNSVYRPWGAVYGRADGIGSQHR